MSTTLKQKIKSKKQKKPPHDQVVRENPMRSCRYGKEEKELRYRRHQSKSPCPLHPSQSKRAPPFIILWFL